MTLLLAAVKRYRKLIGEGLRKNSSWKLGIGVLGFVFGHIVKASRQEPETVKRIVLQPGDRVVVRTKVPPESPRKHRRHRAERRATGGG